MIKNGFTYIAALVFIAAILVNLPRLFKGRIAKGFFKFAPPVVLIYLSLMLLCTFKLWDTAQTAIAYSFLKNPLLYTMLFLMLLRCDMKKIVKLGPKMLLGFFCAAFSIILGFVIAYGVMHPFLGVDAWKSLGALAGSWLGGGGNMMALQEVLHVDESAMGYALVTDSVCATFYIMFLLWAIGFSEKFNKWTKADTRLIDKIGHALENEARSDTRAVSWQNIILLLGSGLFVSALCTDLGAIIANKITIFDKSTWTVLLITLLGICAALTPLGRIKGTEEISNVLLYTVIALIASRADLSAVTNAPVWLLTGFGVLIFHAAVMLLLAKIFKLDIFTCAVASLANIGGTATAPVLAGSYSASLVSVGIIMALLGYIVGTPGGMLAAALMSLFG